MLSDFDGLARRLSTAHPNVPMLPILSGNANELMRLHLTFLTGGDVPPVRVSFGWNVSAPWWWELGHGTYSRPALQLLPEHKIAPSVNVSEVVGGGLDILPASGDLFLAPGIETSVVVRIRNETSALCASPR